MSLPQVEELLLGPEGSSVTLSLRRDRVAAAGSQTVSTVPTGMAAAGVATSSPHATPSVLKVSSYQVSLVRKRDPLGFAYSFSRGGR